MARRGPKRGRITHRAVYDERGSLIAPSLAAAARKLGMTPGAITQRLIYGWPIEAAVTLPPSKGTPLHVRPAVRRPVDDPP